MLVLVLVVVTVERCVVSLATDIRALHPRRERVGLPRPDLTLEAQVIAEENDASGGGWHRRTTVQLLEQQLDAVGRFHADRRMREQARARVQRAREDLLDAARSMEVLRRQTEALLARSAQTLQASGRTTMTDPAPCRAIVGHRNAWFTGRLAAGLTEFGIVDLTCHDNGAEVVGAAVVEQPDLVLVEQHLAMMRGYDVVRQLRHYCTGTVVAAQVPYAEDVEAMVDAGAVAVFTRQVPPAQVAAELGRLLFVGHSGRLSEPTHPPSVQATSVQALPRPR